VCWSKCMHDCSRGQRCVSVGGIIVCGRGHGPPARAARMALHVRLSGCAALMWGLCVESGDVLLIVILFPCTHEAGNS
jgi:hypothetical protein